MLKEEGYEIVNIDSLVKLESPKLKDYKRKMEETIALHLEISPSLVNVKAGTNEGLDAVGRNEAIEASAVVLIRKVK
jgi:2-C-methyl-D-erythritol 2,4-cyclodiphosphate synthase